MQCKRRPYVRYKKIAPRRGHKRAVIAVAHTMLRAIYFMLKNNESFRDLGADYYFSLDADRIKNRNVKNLEKLGFSVSLSPSQPFIQKTQTRITRVCVFCAPILGLFSGQPRLADC